MTSKLSKGLALASLALSAAVASAQQGISVTVDGNPVQFEGQGPRSIDGRVLVPLRGVFEDMGAYVQWHPNRREVVAVRGGSNVRLNIGSRDAIVDGKNVTLDVPAMIVNGSTMVPIRFLSESLGAEVRWRSADQMVMIITGDNSGRAETIINEQDSTVRNRRRDNDERPWRTETLTTDTVIPVRLDDGLSSIDSRRGDTFTATIRTDGDRRYGMLPAGTQIVGKVVTARPQRGNDPGLLELDFQKLRLPNGRSYSIDGQLVSLEDGNIVRGDNGIMRTSGNNKDNRTVYAGYGAGAGLVLGLLTKKPLEGTILGGALGYLAGQVQKDQRRPSNVRLAPGTEFGVRLTRDVAVSQRDLG